MGNEAEFHLGKRRSREGLEFVGAPKRPRFNQHSTGQRGRGLFGHSAAPQEESRQQEPVAVPEAQPIQPTQPNHAPVVPPVPPEALLPAEPPQTDPLAHIYQEPLLTPALTGDRDESMMDDLAYQGESLDEAGKTGTILLHDVLPPKTPWFRTVLAYMVALIAVAILSLSGLFLMTNKPDISDEIKNKVGFTVYELTPNTTFKIDRKSVQVAAAGNLVFFIDNTSTKAHYVVSEQKIPSEVKNDEDYQKFLSSLDKYAEFKSTIGTAYFTRPGNIGNDVSVVVKTPTTLLFIRGPGATSEQDWTKLIDFLKVAK